MDIRLYYTISVLNEQSTNAALPVLGVKHFQDVKGLDIAVLFPQLLVEKWDKIAGGAQWEMTWQAMLISDGPNRHAGGAVSIDAMVPLVQEAQRMLASTDAL